MHKCTKSDRLLILLIYNDFLGQWAWAMICRFRSICDLPMTYKFVIWKANFYKEFLDRRVTFVIQYWCFF